MRRTSHLPRKRARAATALAAVGALIMSAGLLAFSAGAASAEPDPKVVVCKYVGTPGGNLHHIVVVSENSLNNTPYSAPPDGDSWTDAHGQSTEGSIAIRYASEGPPPEQASTISLSECPGTPVPEQPEPLVESSSDTDLTCEEATETTTTTTTEYVLVEGEWVLGEPDTEVSSSTREPTVDEIASLGEECIAGEEVLIPKDKPGKKPTVAGVEAVAPAAAAPTAVAAGIASPASSPLQLVSQMLVAGGMLLLMAGAWIGLGRRESGTHEA